MAELETAPGDTPMDAQDANNDDAVGMEVIGAMEPSAGEFIGDLFLQQL